MNDLTPRIFALIGSLSEFEAEVTADTALIGDGRILDSIKLVELCVELEDLAGENGFVFDWTSETAMSRSRSMFRSAGALAAEFSSQQAAARA
ncbi:hypothetical protein [Pseudoxanthomonas sp. 10H]|uniref:hypothetical protein n=1 Tax=Pseudoxanthomonas sp. 10H TaxID=3242729 RepID=UPI00355726B4